MEQVLKDKKSAEEPSRSPLPLDAARIAITERFVDVAGHIDIHHLWTDACGACFRVNWWSLFLKGTVETGRICRSAFVRVFHDGEQLQVEDRTNVAETRMWRGVPGGTQPGAPPEAGSTSGSPPGL